MLTGEVRDGSALYGIIALLEALSLELIEIKPLTTAPAGPPPTSGVPGGDDPESGAFC